MSNQPITHPKIVRRAINCLYDDLIDDEKEYVNLEECGITEEEFENKYDGNVDNIPIRKLNESHYKCLRILDAYINNIEDEESESESEEEDYDERRNMSINPSLKIIKDYTKWSFAVTGNTFRHKESLKKLGGKYNKNLKCGAGWIFRKRDLDDALKVINDINSAELIILINSKTGRTCDYIDWTYSDLCQRYDSLCHYDI